VTKVISKGGRPTVITPNVVRKLEEAFHLDVDIQEACLVANISRDTYYRKCKEDKGFSDTMEKARMFATWKARKTVVKELGNNSTLALKYLERKRKREFSPRTEFTGASGDPIQVTLLPGGTRRGLGEETAK